MNGSHLPLFKFPTTMLLVDDHQPFLENAPAQLNTNYIYQTFDKPKALLQKLNHTYQSIFELKHYMAYDLAMETKQHHRLQIDLSTLRQLLYDRKRYQEIAAIIIDYDMPSMDGLTFCQQLKNPYIKKIMITGQADYEVAVQAFNEGIIDKFILKQTTDFFGELNPMIEAMHHAYFQSLTQVLHEDLKLSPYYCLHEPAVIDLISSIIKEFGIKEYYLIDESGSLLLMNTKNEQRTLLIKSEVEMALLTEIASDNAAPPALLQSIQNRELLPYLLTEADYALPVSQWQQCCHQSKIITGQHQNYYYSLTPLTETHTIGALA